MTKQLIAAILIACALAGCATPGAVIDSSKNAEGVEVTIIHASAYAVFRIVDTNAGVVCYLGTGSGTSIDCLPLAETDLR